MKASITLQQRCSGDQSARYAVFPQGLLLNVVLGHAKRNFILTVRQLRIYIKKKSRMYFF